AVKEEIAAAVLHLSPFLRAGVVRTAGPSRGEELAIRSIHLVIRELSDLPCITARRRSPAAGESPLPPSRTCAALDRCPGRFPAAAAARLSARPRSRAGC